MGLQNPVNFRTSQPNAAAMLAAAPQKADAARDQERFERHLDDNQPRDTEAADRRDHDRRADRRERDRAADARAKRSDDKVTDGDTTQTTDAKSTTADTDDTLSALVNATAKSDDAKTGVKPETTEKPAETEAVAVVAAPVELAATPKAADDKDAALATAKPEATDPKADKGDEQAAEADPKAGELAAHSTVPTGHQTETRKSDTKVPKAEQKTTTAPVPASLTPLVAAANNAPVAEAPKAETTNTDPEAGLTIKSADASGNEAAAKSSDNKTDAKAGAAQQANTPAQTQNAAAEKPAQSFAKALAAAAGSEVTSVSSTSSSAPASLSDLQNVSTTSTQTNNTATVRIGTLPGQTTPTQVPAMAIALQVARNLQKGVNRFDIRLDPAEMGRIDVRMEVKKDGKVAAHLIVERPETLDLLRRDASSLQQALNDAGLQANSDSLNFSLRDDNAGNDAQDFTSNLSGNGSVSKADTQPDEIGMSPVYNVNLSANGGVDIRI
ncbi:MAG: flagellar hook-length control protein FliK [Pseudomonadota bacterium]